MLRLSVGLWLAMLAVGADGEWRVWSPREEITPRSAARDGELILEGAGNPGVFGGWQRAIASVKPNEWYRLAARYTANGLTQEPFQILMRVDWVRADGYRAGQPEYAYSVETSGEWRTISLRAAAPANAVSAKIQLLLQNAPKAVVRWKDVTFEAVANPGPRNVTVAAVRFHPSRGTDPLARFIDLVDQKTPPGVDIILLPEGATMVRTGKTYADCAEAVPGPTTKRLGETARKHHAWIVAGLIEREGNRIYNTSVLLDREGRLAGRYRKVYLPREEIEGGITAGSEYPVFQTDFGKIGMMICWDVQYADPARALALRGAELILMPIWGGSELLASARAQENHVFIASSGYDFPAMVLDPNGKAITRSEADGSIVTATVDLNGNYADEWLGNMRARFMREVRTDIAVEPDSRR